MAQSGEVALAAKRSLVFEPDIRLAALDAERDALRGLARRRSVNDRVHARLTRDLDLAEARARS